MAMTAPSSAAAPEAKNISGRVAERLRRGGGEKPFGRSSGAYDGSNSASIG
jgi:hypothetical protein